MIQQVGMNSRFFLLLITKQVPEWELWAVIIPVLAILALLALKMVRAVGKRTGKETN